MARNRKWRYFACDFETTVYDGQEFTEVWSSAFCELYDESEQVIIHGSIDETFRYFTNTPDNFVLYYHNLKFDGAFWLWYIIHKTDLKPAINEDNKTEGFVEFGKMQNNTYSYAISDMGQWYFIRLKYKNKIVEIRDSLKLLPMQLKKIGKDFKTKHQKLDMEYTGFRYSGCKITDAEKQYIKNDVLVLKEALEIMFDKQHNKLTIGACCMTEFKNDYTKDMYKAMFPNLTELTCYIHCDMSVDDWIRKSYKGGWCYLKEGCENQVYYNGCTADVNSLYPSVMFSESNNKYPIGQPHFWKGNYIDQHALVNNRYYFIEIETQFYLKENYLPFIQIKNDIHYKATEMLKTSDYYDHKTNTYVSKVIDNDGNIVDVKAHLVLTCVDYNLMLDHYDLKNCKIIGGCWFESASGIFDMYIDKYRQIKINSEGAQRTIAKLFLNNLYGKFASNTDSSFKFATKFEDIYKFETIEQHEKTAGFIPIGSAVTSYARYFTIRHAQANYKYFIYADTDSIHCCCNYNDLIGIEEHDTDFLKWKIESEWDKAIFVRQKTYIEHVVKENKQEIEQPYYNIKCAGMNQRCKDLFNASMGEIEIKPKTQQEKEFLKTHRTITDFKKGLKIPSKLMPVLIRGGILLKNTSFEMR